MLLSGLMSVNAMEVLAKIFFRLSYGVLSLYPAISQQGPDRFQELKPDRLVFFVISFMQLFLSAVVLILTFKCGKQKGNGLNKAEK